MTLTAYDQSSTRATGYRGTVRFTSSDGAATLPASYTFTARDAGSHSFKITLKTAGLQTLSVVDSTPASSGGPLTASTMPPITVSPAKLASLLVTGPTAPVTAGSPFSLTVSARDGWGNLVPSYHGTIHVTSSDKQVSAGNGLPSNYTFTTGGSTPDTGSHTFSGVVLKTAGSASISVSDTTTTTIKGSITLTVQPGSAALILLKTPSKVMHGKPFSVTLTMQDAYGNTATGYGGTVSFSSSAGSSALLPAPYTFTATDQGVHSVTATVTTTGSVTITATDSLDSSITGTSPGIKVT